MHFGLTSALIVLLMALVGWQQCMPGCLPRPRSSAALSARCHLDTPRLFSRLGRSTQQQKCQLVPGINHSVAGLAARIYAGPNTGSGSGDAGSEQPQQQPKQAQAQRPGPLQVFVSRVKLLLRILGTIVLLVAAAPYLISSRFGTAVAAAGASRVLPGDVLIQRISLGWTQPLAVHGLSVYEGAAGSSRQLLGLQRISSAGQYTLQVKSGSITVQAARSTSLLRRLCRARLMHTHARMHICSHSSRASATCVVTLCLC